MFDFGNHLRMLREKHGISQDELGRRVGRVGSVISNYENNLKVYGAYDCQRRFFWLVRQ